ncbi:MAG: helix-turn-helix transcriptional regulator, partial [Niameybacter sp.]
MNISLGEKIKALRKQKNISQETLANYLGLSFQAVSKWENALAMPDVTLIPAIASFFGVSIDDLFDFNLYE